jgi:hypothetical protein
MKRLTMPNVGSAWIIAMSTGLSTNSVVGMHHRIDDQSIRDHSSPSRL